MTKHDMEGASYRWSYDEYSAGHSREPRTSASGGLKIFLIILAAVVAVCVGLYVCLTLWSGRSAGGYAANNSGLSNLPQIAQENKPESGGQSASGSALTPVQIYKKCSASVVGVIVRGASNTVQGTGIVMSAEGYIITNAHVVSGGQTFEVVLSSGQTADASLIGADKQTDLALLKLNKTDETLTAATFGNSDELEVGEQVVAIGNPGGIALASSQTVGYVSAVSRTIQTETGYTMNCIQADVAINPGNSGGPLINSYGQVVGITSSKLVEQGYEGIGFSIPINQALPILNELMANGKVTGRAMLGVTVSLVNSTTASTYNIPTGLLVQSVNDGADIGAKGVQRGDIITAVDGRAISSFSDCSEALSKHKPGDTVKISVYRQSDSGEEQQFDLEIVLQGS